MHEVKSKSKSAQEIKIVFASAFQETNRENTRKFVIVKLSLNRFYTVRKIYLKNMIFSFVLYPGTSM